MDFINIVKPIDEAELDAALSGVPATAAATAIATTPATPANRATLDTTDRVLFDDLFAFDDVALLELVRNKRDVTIVELHLADRLTSALEAVEELEAMLQVNQGCPTATQARRARLH